MSEESPAKRGRRRKRKRARRGSGGSAQRLYVDQNAKPISKDEWYALRGDEEYLTIKQYENEKILCLVQWHGIIPHRLADPLFVDSWPVFVVKGFNKKEDGTWRTDPIYTTEHCSKADALKKYEELLVGYTESESEVMSVEDYDSEGNLTVVEQTVVNEVGNLRSPEVVKQKEFQSHYESDDSAGSW